MCNLYSITTNQAAIIALFRVVNRYVGNLAPMPGVFPRNLTKATCFLGAFKWRRPSNSFSVSNVRLRPATYGSADGYRPNSQKAMDQAEYWVRKLGGMVTCW